MDWTGLELCNVIGIARLANSEFLYFQSKATQELCELLKCTTSKTFPENLTANCAPVFCGRKHNAVKFKFMNLQKLLECTISNPDSILLQNQDLCYHIHLYRITVCLTITFVVPGVVLSLCEMHLYRITVCLTITLTAVSS